MNACPLLTQNTGLIPRQGPVGGLPAPHSIRRCVRLEHYAIQVAVRHCLEQDVRIKLLLRSRSRQQQGVEAKGVDLAWNIPAPKLIKFSCLAMSAPEVRLRPKLEFRQKPARFSVYGG